MAPQIRNRMGISNVVATIILIAVAIALAVAVAVWVFGLAGSSAKSATLNVEQSVLNIPLSGSAVLTLVVSNPSSSSIGINGFTLGGLTCSFNTPITVPGGTQGATIQITLSNSGANTQASGFSSVIASTLGVSSTSISSSSSTCTGSVTLTPGVQFSGELITTSGQTYPITVSS